MYTMVEDLNKSIDVIPANYRNCITENLSGFETVTFSNRDIP